jgi:hypothetical protein
LARSTKVRENRLARWQCIRVRAHVAAKDARVSTVVIWNSGCSNAAAPMYMNGSTHRWRSSLAGRMTSRTRTPMPTSTRSPARFRSSTGNFDVGHLATYSQDNGGEFARAGVAWLQWQLFDDESAKGKGMFVGKDCGLCKTDWVIEKKNMD